MAFQDRGLVEDSKAASFAKRREPPLYLQRIFARLDPVEMRLVRRFVSSRLHPVALRLALIINKLGDGWIYLLLAIGMIGTFGRQALMPVLLALASAGLAHLLYPLIKGHIARPRPFEQDPGLTTACAPLDKYSCPSGHIMTASAVFLPLAFAYPTLAVALAVIWCLLAWARLAIGHHYASDLVIGAGLGTASFALCDRFLTPSFDTLLAAVFAK
jgi:undecaprenyl-diphosphatase